MIVVDASTGLVISHTSAPRKRMFEDLETAAKAMREQDERKESIFRQSVDAEENKEDLFDKEVCRGATEGQGRPGGETTARFRPGLRQRAPRVATDSLAAALSQSASE